jgi:hypothetical protein
VTLPRGGRLAALLMCLSGTATGADLLVISRVDDGSELARLPAPEGAEWCLRWHHSVAGFEVSDCYRNRGGVMVLDHALVPDFAAGLGHIPGRGQQVSDGQGGYRIEGIDEAVPGNAYVIRPGEGPVDHRIQIGDTLLSLSALAPRARLRIALIEDDP